MAFYHILFSEVFHVSGDAVWAVPRPRHHPHPRNRFLRSDLRLQLNFDWFHSTLPPELDCCDEAFLNEDRLQPENMQRCLNLEIDGQCIAFTRWTINLLKDVKPWMSEVRHVLHWRAVGGSHREGESPSGANERCNCLRRWEPDLWVGFGDRQRFEGKRGRGGATEDQLGI